MQIFRNLREKMSIFMPRHGLADFVSKVEMDDLCAKTNSHFAKVISTSHFPGMTFRRLEMLEVPEL